MSLASCRASLARMPKERGPMDLDKVRNLLRALPEISESTDSDRDLLATAEEFSKTLRKLGLRQMQEVREALAAVETPGAQVEEVRAAWQREQQRAVDAERQSERLARVLVGTLDQLRNLQAGLGQVAGLGDWAEQAGKALTLCHREAEKVGLVALAAAGDPFDAAVHDTINEVSPASGSSWVVTDVKTQGYSWNGAGVRRALVALKG